MLLPSLPPHSPPRAEVGSKQRLDRAITNPHKLMRRARVFTLAASGARVVIVADSGVLFTFGVPSTINKANETENVRTHLKKDGASVGTKIRGRLRIRARNRVRDRVKRRIRLGKRQAASNYRISRISRITV